MAKKWIKPAIKHPGALRKQLGVPKGKTIPKTRLQTAAKAKGTLGKRARLAITLAKLPEPSPAARKRGGRKAARTRRK